MLKLSKQSSKEEMRILIKFIGFKYSIQHDIYEYKQYGIDLYNDHYDFHIKGCQWKWYDYNDLTPILKLTRSIKLRKILL